MVGLEIITPIRGRKRGKKDEKETVLSPFRNNNPDKGTETLRLMT